MSQGARRPAGRGKTADPQHVVRVANLMKFMGEYEDRYDEKVRVTQVTFGYRLIQDHVEPLRRRIEYLELPWYRKLKLWGEKQIALLRARTKAESLAVEPAAPVPVEAPAILDDPVARKALAQLTLEQEPPKS